MSNEAFAWRERLRARLGRPVDAASLAVLRIGFGSIMLLELWHFFELRRIERYYLQPKLLFPYYGFGWLRPMSAPHMSWLFAGLILLAALIAVGLAYRWASLLFFVGYSYTFVLDQSNYQNHLYLHCLLALLLTVVDAHQVWSLDALLAKQRSRFIPQWQTWLLTFQLAMPYFFGGLNKLNRDWLSGAPQALELSPMAERFHLPFLATPLASYLTAWGGLGIDLLAVPLLCWHRSRLPMYLVLVLFHLTNSQLFSIGVFPWFMIVATTMFFPPDWPRRVWQRLSKSDRAPELAATQSQLAGWQLYCLCGYAALQLLLPLRRVAYPGDSTWRHEARYFNWDMKLNVRKGRIALFAEDAHGKSERVQLDRFLTHKQLEHLSYTPDMVVTFSKFAFAHLPKGAGYKLRWDSQLSINGGPSRPFVLEDAALIASQDISLWPTRIVREPAESPPLKLVSNAR